jgi:hypothetical protein
MRAGNWKLTHQGIAFNCDGTLLDGQHRLAAIVKSGKDIQMLVARGVETENQVAMDDHAKRSAGDALSLLRSEQIKASKISVIRASVELSGDKVDSYIRLTRQELNQVFDTFRPAIEFVDAKIHNKQRGISTAPVKAAIVLAWFYVEDIKRLEKFVDILAGKLLPESNGDRAAVVLREWLLRNGINPTREARVEGFKKTQRAIVAFCEYKDIGKLYGTSTYYPWPLVDPVRRYSSEPSR